MLSRSLLIVASHKNFGIVDSVEISSWLIDPSRICWTKFEVMWLGFMSQTMAFTYMTLPLVLLSEPSQKITLTERDLTISKMKTINLFWRQNSCVIQCFLFAKQSLLLVLQKVHKS